MASEVGRPSSVEPPDETAEDQDLGAVITQQHPTQLNEEQRRELVELQQQIQVQLREQQMLAKSIQELPIAATDAAASSAGENWARQGPNPGGDAPADDPEGGLIGDTPVARIDPEEVAAELPSDVHRAQAPARSLNNGCRHAAVTGAPMQGPPVELPPLRVDRPPENSSSRDCPPRAADVGRGGPPGRDERRWIEAAVRRMFRSIGPITLDTITEAFREQKLKAAVDIVKQAAPIATGPGLCVLFEGVIDVLHRPVGTDPSAPSEKVCTYDRCGQCFGELELCYDAPRAGAGRRRHWATIATRTAVTLWSVDRNVLKAHVRASSLATAERAISTECV